MSVMNIRSILVEAMYWLTAIGTLMVTIGSGFQAVSAISAYQVELAESGLKNLFDLYVNPLRATLQGSGWLRPTLKLLNPVNVVRVVFGVAKNISNLLRIPATDSPEIVDTSAAEQTVPGKIANAALTDGDVKDVIIRQVAADARVNRIAKAARIRQLLLTGAVWMIILYGSFFLLGAAGVQLYLYYTS